MLRIAADYDRLAKRAALRAQGASSQRPKVAGGLTSSERIPQGVGVITLGIFDVSW
jgi:hypothetical protein